MVRLTVEISSPRRRRDALQALLLPVVLNTALEAPRMHTMVAEKAPAKSRDPRARFSPEAASWRETRTTHRLASHGPLPQSSVLNRPRPHVERCPTLRWPDRLETAPKKTIAWLFAWFWPFSRRKAVLLLPRFLQRVARLPVPMAYTKCFARGCPRAELRAALGAFV